MAKKVLIVVDMLKDFVDPDGALSCGEPAQKIILYIQKQIARIRKEGGRIVFLADSHKEDDREFELFPKHCIKGSEGAKIIDELEVKEDDYVIEKTRYSGFYGTNLEEVLARENPDEVHVVGVCTSICVMDTVSGLRDRDYKTFVHKNGVADFDPEAHQFSLKRMEKILGAKIV